MRKLLDYQQEGLNLCDNDFVILNWCRNSGKTFMIPIIIEHKNMQNCIYYGWSFENSLKYAIVNFTSFKIVESDKNCIYMKKDNEDYYIWNGKCINLNENFKYDCIFYDEYFPCLYNIQSKKNICTLSINNGSHWIESKFPTSKVMNIDYKKVIENKLLNEKHLLNLLSINKECEKFKSEYGILLK